MVAPVAIYADPVSILVWASLFSVLAIGSLLIAQIITRKSGNATLKRAALYTVTALSAYLAIGMFIRLITHKPIVELTEKSIRIDPPAAITIVIPWYAVEEIRTVLSCKRMFVREVAAIQTSQQFFDAQPYLARILFFYGSGLWHDNAPKIAIYHDLLAIGARELCDTLKKCRAQLPKNK